MASKAAGMAPAKIMLVLFKAIPPKINSPKPPAPIYEASVATPTFITVAVLIPASITGMDKGNSTLVRI